MTDPRAEDVRRGYEPVARAYREHLAGELAGKPLDRAFLDAFAERTAGALILDVGCGPGHVARYLASRGARVEGIDLSPAMIDEARASHPEAVIAALVEAGFTIEARLDREPYPRRRASEPAHVPARSPLTVPGGTPRKPPASSRHRATAMA